MDLPSAHLPAVATFSSLISPTVSAVKVIFAVVASGYVTSIPYLLPTASVLFVRTMGTYTCGVSGVARSSPSLTAKSTLHLGGVYGGGLFFVINESTGPLNEPTLLKLDVTEVFIVPSCHFQ